MPTNVCIVKALVFPVVMYRCQSWTIKNPDPGKDRRQEEKGMTEVVMVGWYHWLDDLWFVHAQGDGIGQGRLACFSLWGFKELDTTERLNNNS